MSAPPLEAADDLAAKINNLERLQRCALIMSYWEQKSDAEIASELGCDEATAVLLRVRAMARIDDHLTHQRVRIDISRRSH